MRLRNVRLSFSPGSHQVVSFANSPLFFQQFGEAVVRRLVHRVEIEHLPIADETAPEEQDFDQIIRELRDLALDRTVEPRDPGFVDERLKASIGRQAYASTALVFNCQMGRGRTTTGMVCLGS